MGAVTLANHISIDIDQTAMQQGLAILSHIKDGGPTAVMRAMNRTVTGMKTDAKREVAKRYTVKQKDVADKLEVYKATKTNLGIALRSRGRPMRLIKFKTKANRRPGVKGSPTAFAQVKKGGAGGFTGGFMATMSSTNGISGVFMRNPGDYQRVGRGPYKGQRKETIKQLYGPGSVQMLAEKNTSKAVKEGATKRFNKEFVRQVNLLLKKR